MAARLPALRHLACVLKEIPFSESHCPTRNFNPGHLAADWAGPPVCARHEALLAARREAFSVPLPRDPRPAPGDGR